MGDYSRKLDRYTNVSRSGSVLAADDLSVTPRSLVTAVTGWTIYVQRISIYVNTDNAATQTFRDTAGTPIVVEKTKASPGIGPLLMDFGPEGFALTESKGLELVNSAAGLAYTYTVVAYMRATATQAA